MLDQNQSSILVGDLFAEQARLSDFVGPRKGAFPESESDTVCFLMTKISPKSQRKTRSISLSNSDGNSIASNGICFSKG